jgi:uncharacterized damage-inducible protein DinB
MSWVEHFRLKYAYNEWANGKVLGAAAGLSDEELLAERQGSYGSLVNDLSHIVRVQYAWHSVVTETQFSPPPELPETGVLPALVSWFDDSHRKLREMADSFSEEWLTATVHPSRGGKTYDMVRWHVLEHLANHGTTHRAEIGIALLGLDRSPGDLDFIDYAQGNVT